MSRDDGSTAADEDDDGVAPDDGGAADQGEDERSGGLAGRAVSGALAAAAWIVGIALIGLGLLGMARSPAGLVYLVPGLFVTPRTRRELRRLCRILCG